MLAGYMGRETGTFVINGINLLDRAINQARKAAERMHRFECARDSVVVRSVNASLGGLLSSAVSLRNQGRPVEIRTIERAYLGYSDNVGQFQIEILSRDADMRDTNRASLKLQANDDAREYPGPITAPYRLVRHNDLIYISPYSASSSTTERDVFMDVVLWLPDYVKDTDTDFFLKHCEDYMLMRAVYQLNFMLKEDQRVVISAKAMEAAWDSVLAVDNDAIAGSSDDSNLE